VNTSSQSTSSRLMPDQRKFLLETLLPFWAGRALDEQDGGFFTELTLAGEPLRTAPKSCLVQARLLYVFSHAYVLSKETWALTAATHVKTFMERHLLTQQGGWVTAAQGGARVQALEVFDLYDHAFVLFGLAWWYKATGDRAAVRQAHHTIDFLGNNLSDPVHGGWHENVERSLPRRQNPHMHLLEAVHALYEATGEAFWLDHAAAIIRLFRDRFYDQATGSLREYLNEDLSPAAGAPGRIREPGHHMEWVWLLLHHQRLTGDNLTEEAERLFASARRSGINDQGLVIEAMDADGLVLDPAMLLWPQTEAVKAALACHEFVDASFAEASKFLEALFRHHIPDNGPLWINRLSPEGERMADTVPTRVLYHLALCLAEYIRLDPSTKGAEQIRL
jgi:mannose/cellobiose epimerase-like protein (N-acyl-D-glucosamine 2-epimerase family)